MGQWEVMRLIFIPVRLLTLCIPTMEVNERLDCPRMTFITCKDLYFAWNQLSKRRKLSSGQWQGHFVESAYRSLINTLAWVELGHV